MARKVEGERLIRLRSERFMERQDLADKSEVSYSTIYKMEKQNYMPSIRKLKAVARALRVSPEELVVASSEAREPSEEEPALARVG